MLSREESLGLKDSVIKESVAVLNKFSGDLIVLEMKTRNAHWNVECPRFLASHAEFEQYYHEFAESIDEVAERIRMLEHYAPDTLADVLDLTQLTEKSFFEKNSREDYLKSLSSDIDNLIVFLRESIETLSKNNDYGTVDLLTGQLMKFEKLGWFIRSNKLDL